MSDYDHWRILLADERLPVAVVDVDAFDRNLNKLKATVQGTSKTIRLATKSVCVPELIKRVQAQGTPFEGIMCSSAEEAVALYEFGFDDFLIALPTLQPSDLAALRVLHERKARIALVVDSTEGLKILAAAMRGVRRAFRVVLDVDATSRLFGLRFGTRRSSLSSFDDVVKLFSYVEQHPELIVNGAMVCESRLLRRTAVRRREEIYQLFRRRGIPIEIFSEGGSGQLKHVAREAVLTEVTAGSDFFSLPQFEPAVFLALQAIRPWMPKEEHLVPLKGASQTRIGDPIVFRHTRPDELFERVGEVLLVSGSPHKIVGRVPTYRGLGHCFF